MDHLDKRVNLRIQDIVEKLQKLDCTLLGNKDDAWVMELLFSPGFHRYHLIEWILSKLEYDIGKMSGPQNSAEERLKNLQSTISDLGLCRQNSHDIIKGTASVKEQLDFWCTLVDIVWLKHEIIVKNTVAESDEGIELSPEKKKCINEEYEHALSAVKNVSESVNVKHLFETEVQLLAPDVEMEVKNISPSKSKTQKFPTLQDIKDIVKQLTPDPLEGYTALLSLNNLSVEESEGEVVAVAELSQLEEDLCNVSVDFQNSCQKNFSCTYDDLRSLVLQVKGDEFTDVGEDFQKLESHLENLSQLEKSFLKLESSNVKLSEINSELKDLLSQETLADSKYASSLKLIKDEN